jgi:nucleotide-binding universal stress UspA family protein
MRMRGRERPSKKIAAEKVNSLERACEEFRRKDLYKPLSYVLDVNIRMLEKDLDVYLKDRRYLIAANVMLYESKLNRARGYFEKALASIGSARRPYLNAVLGNLGIAAQIARRFWELEGKYSRANMRAKIAQPSFLLAGGELTDQEGILFHRILVSVDGSKNALRAAKTAVNLAKRNSSELIVVSVIPRPQYLFGYVPEFGVPPIHLGDYFAYGGKDAQKWVDEVLAHAKGQGVSGRGRVLRGTSIVRSIADYAEDQRVDLIVLGTRGSGGFKKLLLGSVSSGVVSHAHCTVMIVR